jgi:phosphomannomutase
MVELRNNRVKEKISNSVPGFKAYDIRGKVPEELNQDMAYKIAQAFADFSSSEKVAIGQDIRLSSPDLVQGLTKGFIDAGVDVLDLGLCGTEEVYFASFHLNIDGIMVTASHNPSNYNGMKFVRKGARPISGDSGLNKIEQSILSGLKIKKEISGAVSPLAIREKYIEHLLSYVNINNLKPLKLVVNPGNGCAGPVIDSLEQYLPFKFVKILDEPDGTFPNGVPNPLLPDNREITVSAMKYSGADLGIAWDGDFDRCFFFTENGDFIEGYYLVGLLAEIILKKEKGAKIIHDPRVIWNTIDLVLQSKGIPVMTKTGHAFIKERMRKEDATYGGEMSAHHYFKKFSYCDSGMIPWLLICEIISTSGKKISELINNRISAFPVSGEINNRVDDPDRIIADLDKHYTNLEGEKDYTDGLSISFPDWRFNLRKSNTEPVLRLNIETRADHDLLKEKTKELLEKITEKK